MTDALFPKKVSLTATFVLWYSILVSSGRCLQVAVVGGEAVLNGTAPLQVMDCQYLIQPGEELGLVVKWYHENNPRPVYQWIHGSTPQALGILKGRLNLDYATSREHLDTHSALAFVAPTTELAGTYTCTVSTHMAEATATGDLIVYSAASYFELKFSEPSAGKTALTCYSGGLFPEPEIYIARTDRNNRRNKMNATINKYWDDAKKSYDVVAETTVPPRQLTEHAAYDCVVFIPRTTYKLQRNLIYRPEWLYNSASSIIYPKAVTVLLLLFLCSSFL